MSTHNGTLSRLDQFLAEAKAKNFPLNYTFMDCALRAYGAFVVWVHFVMYLIFRHIYSDTDPSVPCEDNDISMAETTQTSSDVVVAEPGTSLASLKLKTARNNSKQSIKLDEKKRNSFEDLKSKLFSMLKTDKTAMSRKTAKIDKAQETGKGSKRDHSIDLEGERQELMRKFLQQNAKNFGKNKSFSVLNLPVWLVLTDHAKNGDKERETRLLMADWLLRRGGMDRKPIMAVPVPRTPRHKLNEPLRPAEPTRSLANVGRAPKGQQADRLASMEQFFERLSLERLSAERFSGESAETLPLKDVVLSAETDRMTMDSGERTEDITQIEDVTQTVSQRDNITPRKRPEAASRATSVQTAYHTPEVRTTPATTTRTSERGTAPNTANTPASVDASLMVAKTPQTDTKRADSIIKALVEYKNKEEAESSKGKEELENNTTMKSKREQATTQSPSGKTGTEKGEKSQILPKASGGIAAWFS